MLRVSLHGIKIFAARGMYAQEKITPNEFETDVDMWMTIEENKLWPFADYSLIGEIVRKAFEKEDETLETFVQNIHSALKKQFPNTEKIKVSIRKLRPPMSGDVKYAEVSFES